MPKNITSLTHLKKLNLGANYDLNSLPENIGELVNLEQLILNEVPLKSLPDSIVNLSNLRVLDLVCVTIDQLPENMANLKNLNRLDLQSIDLYNFPSWILQLSELTYLGLNEVGLSVIPEEIGKLTKLSYLDIGFNEELTELPQSIGELSKLQTLDLTCCYLNELPESITKLYQLEDINLDANQLYNLSEEVKNFLENLGIVLSDNDQKDIRSSNINQDLSCEAYLDEVPKDVSIDNVELDESAIENIEQEVINVLDKIIQDNLTDFKQDSSFKVRPGYGYDKFYLDSIEGSYDMSLYSLVHYIMYEDGHYRKFLNKSQYARLLQVIKEYPENIFSLDHELDENYDHIQHDLIERIYVSSIKFVGKTLIKNGFDVKDTFRDYLYDLNDTDDGDE